MGKMATHMLFDIHRYIQKYDRITSKWECKNIKAEERTRKRERNETWSMKDDLLNQQQCMFSLFSFCRWHRP